ncbi:SEC-C metal-binding domain-containing protein [Sporosarcina sp. HYO08]|uniref:SEC-C metal-binding domain-containing protein n=1 Tax=Sporosarcina sp. HYO08 TaxID=1759557 RepID=UPI0007918B17|nr:SEC-C metal-binding domain-containing protein [Sporosarcina sp. HYO08]KXH87036.1 hypothetical protein AU377_00190 [Sporosarcina sp. HYO08]
MIGRNDPCPCGSGKKYKKCCALKNEKTNEQLVEVELERILVKFFENAVSLPADYAELERTEREWRYKLGKWLSNEDISERLAEYFLFVARTDLWKRYLLRTLNQQMRPVVRTVLEKWQNPIVLLARPIAIYEDYFVVEEVLGRQKYSIPRKKGMEVGQNHIVFGIVLPDERERENGIYLIEGLTFIYNKNRAFERKIESFAEESGYTASHEFFKAHMADIHKIIATMNDADYEDVDEAAAIIKENLTSEQQEVAKILEEKIASLQLHEEGLTFLRLLTASYFVRNQPIFRKPEVIAASLFKVANDIDLIEGDYSQAEIGEKFGISPGSMKKHVDKLHDLVDEMMKDVEEKENTPPVAYSIGTDPLRTERFNWEMLCKTSSLTIETMDQLQAVIQQTMNEPFEPAGKEQRAQAFAYGAYDAEDGEERRHLAEQAFAEDPENVDALLLQVEMAENEQEIERLYKQAIQNGEKLFDDEPEIPWGLVTNRPYMRAIFAFGVFLYENDRKSEAAGQFDKLVTLNPSDHQGARYLAVASFIQSEAYEKASEVLQQYEDQAVDEAAYLYLKWYLEMEMAGGEANERTVALFDQAVKANPHVNVLIEGDTPKISMPKQQAVSSGSVEEANYIWYLL